MIEKSSIETLMQRVDIVDIVGSYLELKRAGSYFKGICPFHNDTTPSLHVSPSRQMYHCFACGAGGDVIRFVMEYEKLNYPEALEKIALMSNFTLTYTNEGGQKREDKKLLEQLNRFYVQNLDLTPAASQYLKDRGIGQSSIQKFEIGYAPRSIDTLNFLRSRFFTRTEGIEMGVIGMGERGDDFARFIERITFPIYSPAGRIVGFGGRTISGHPAKYVNSPQSKVFNKSRLLYGYNIARETIMKSRRIIVCEGYLDVVMLHQAGFNEAVATLGTALTSEHVPLLLRGEPKVILSYDGDAPGVEAAFKASKLLSAHNIEGGVVLFSGNMDPADMVQKGLIDKLNALYNAPKEFIEFCLEHIAGKYNLKDAHDKERALEEALAYLRTLRPTIAYSYVGILAQMLNVRPNHIILGSKKPSQTKSGSENYSDTTELEIIKTLLVHPNFTTMVLDMVDVSMFKTHDELFGLIYDNNLDDSRLRELLFRDSVRVYEEDELLSALMSILTPYYNELLERIKKSSVLDFEHKGVLLRKVRDIISKIRNGELVP
jgi:DNA primase